MIDVSAQSCNVTPLSPTTLTATGGAIAYGTMNVSIQCSCTESDGTVVNTVRWYNPDGTKLVTTLNAQYNPDAPYFTRVNANSNRDVILVIPTFNDSYNGTYTCGRNVADRSALTPPTADVTLTTTISELMINEISCLLHICSNVVALINCYLYSEMVKFIVKAQFAQM